MSLRSSLAFAGATALLGVALIGGAPAARAQVFNENFESTAAGNDPTTFTDQSGSFAVVNPGANGTHTYQSFNGAGPTYAFATANGVSLTNAQISFDLLNASDSGAVLRYAGGNAIVVIVRPRVNDIYFAVVQNNMVVGTGGTNNDGHYGETSLGGTDTGMANNPRFTGGSVSSGTNYRVTYSSSRSGSDDTFNATVFDASGTNALVSTTYTFTGGVQNATGTGGFYQYSLVDAANGQTSQFDNVTIQDTPEPNTFLLALPALGSVGAVVLRRRRRACAK